MTNESIRDKIRKLLKIASCESASPAEKAAALHQAARMSQKHAIDLDALGTEASAFGSTPLAEFGIRSPSWCLAVGYVLCKHFNVRCFCTKTRSERGGRDATWYCFGCQPSRDVAVYVWTYLQREFLRAERDLRTSKGKRGDRSSFFISLAMGVITRLDELSKQDSNQNFALIENRLESEYRHYSENFGVLRTPNIDPNRDAYQRGREIEIRPAINTPERKAIAQ